jgi:hypothetical protein
VIDSDFVDLPELEPGALWLVGPIAAIPDFSPPWRSMRWRAPTSTPPN